MKVHFVQHEVFEAPGACLQWALQRNYSVSFSKVFENEALPTGLNDIDLLIIMGGPQSPGTTKEDCAYFDAVAEIKLIQSAIEANKAVLGICLGAQLIGEAMGAKVEKSPEKEIGVWPIELTLDGKNDNKIAHFGNRLFAGHWHNDMPGLTNTSKVLATSAGCPRQIISYTNLVYGFQCHMELNTEVAGLLIEQEKDFLEHNTTYTYVQKPDEIRVFDFTEMNQKLFGFLDKLIVAKLSI